MRDDPPDNARRPGRWEVMLLLACLAAYVVARLPWIGHLLWWDEAMILMSTRTFVTQSTDYYADWFYMHPPMLHLLLALLAPLRDHFAERAQGLLVALGVVNCVLLYRLNRRAFGGAAATWAVFFYAVMPGAVFFDLWIKQDPLVILFGLLAIHSALYGKRHWTGLFLGGALLAKELAAYYIAAVCVVWFLRKPRKAMDLVVPLCIAAILSAWWYVVFSHSVSHIIKFALGKPVSGGVAWVAPWHYFLAKLPLNLGVAGLCLAVAGVAVAWQRRRGEGGVAALWPLALLVPSYLVISAMPGKSPWFTTSLFPALATLAGLGAAAACDVAGRLAGGRAAARAGAALAVAVLAAWPRAATGYEDFMRRQDRDMWWGSQASRQAALKMNELVRDGQRALVTPSYYWVDQNYLPDPIFAYYLKDIPVLVRPFDIGAKDFVEAVREHRIDWAMVSAVPGVAEKELVYPLYEATKLKPIALDGALIYETTPLYREATASPPP